MTEVGSKVQKEVGAPSWQDYIDALKLEGRRYRPASLSKALEERDRAAGKPSDPAKQMK